MKNKEKIEKHYYRGNQLKQLRAFCATAEHGSMSLAGEAIYQSQSAISLQIKALETSLEARLFDRHGPRIQLTHAGRTLHQLAQPLVDGLQALPEQFLLSTRGQLESGNVEIAAGESTIIYLLPEMIRRFKDQYPGININLHNVTGRDGMQMLRDDKVDLAVGSMLDVPNDIEYRNLFQFAPMLITAEDHPLAGKDSIGLEDIAQYGLILPPKRLSTWRLVDRVFQQAKVPYEVVLEIGGWEVIKRYVEQGFGISIVTSICLRKDESLHTRDMSRFFPQRRYGVVLRRGKWLSAPAQAFADSLGEANNQQSPWLKGDSQR